MNPPIPKSVCEEEMQNADLDTNEVIIEYMTDAHGNKIPNTYPVMIISILYLKKILHKRGK